ncbi:hypothetical protein DYB34_001190 [Aphanomyces astaci]|uniref:Centrosomal protein of 70 kDa n=1 Tax=Aphanomyces astaci TaxID=112090 RepID=A0A3R6ZXS0_APHAT|nr:hypothetical protein DYB34_001190 [Aphanomyces astaci]
MNSTSLSDLDVDHASSASVDRFLLEHGIEFSSSSMEEEKETSFSLQLTDSRLERDEPLTLDDFSPMRPTEASAVHPSTSSESAWRPLNSLLAQHGFSPVELVPTATGLLPKMDALYGVVHDLISQLERRGQIIQDLVLDSDINAKKQTKVETSLASSGKHVANVTDALERSQLEVQSLKTQLERASAKADSDQKAYKLQKTKLEQQLKMSEHRVKAKEALVDRLQVKLQQVTDKDAAAKSRTRHVFRDIHMREPRRTSAADVKALELIAMYEHDRDKMEGEIRSLQSQVQELCCDVRDKENVLLRQSSNGLPKHREDAFVERLEAARLEQEQSARKLRQQEALIQDKVAKIDADLRASKQVVADLRDENANLHLEVQSRPSIRDYKATQRRVMLLERQLHDQQVAVTHANTLDDLRQYMGTAELIYRDKQNAKLHLNRLSTLPKEACLEVMQDICRQLDLTDVTLIGPSVAKLISVVHAVPRMEKFIRDVCACVQPSAAIEKVIPTLTKWKQNLDQLESLQAYAAQINAALMKRTYENVEDTHTNDPLSPKEVFLFVNEMNNALASIKEALNLRKSSIVPCCLQTQRNLSAATTASVTSTLQDLRTALQQTPSTRPTNTSESYVVTSKSDIVGVAAVRQQHLTLTKLKQVLGAQSTDELVPRATRY